MVLGMGSLLLILFARGTQGWRTGWEIRASANEPTQRLACLTGGFRPTALCLGLEEEDGGDEGRMHSWLQDWAPRDVSLCKLLPPCSAKPAVSPLSSSRACGFLGLLGSVWAPQADLKSPSHTVQYTAGCSWSPVGMLARPCCAPFWPMISGGLWPAVWGAAGLCHCPWPPTTQPPFVGSLVCP